MRNVLTLVFLATLITSSGFAGSFVNGGFEDNSYANWTQGAGRWTSSMAWPIDPSLYMPGGARYNMAYWQGTIVDKNASPTDPITGDPTVAVGRYSARINNSINDYSVGVISQTVVNYTDPKIYFGWSAVLEASHGLDDSDNFSLVLTNDTEGLTLYSVSYSSASAPGIFKHTGNWYWSGWQLQTLDVSAHSGDTLTLRLLGSDCPYGGHAGYVYLDGFGADIPDIPGVPEPSTYAYMALGIGGLLLARRRR